MLAIEAGDQGRTGKSLLFEGRAQQQIQHDAADHGQQAHDHRRIPAMPDRQVVFGQRTPHDRPRGSGQQRAHGLCGEDADDQAGQHQ